MSQAYSSVPNKGIGKMLKRYSCSLAKSAVQSVLEVIVAILIYKVVVVDYGHSEYGMMENLFSNNSFSTRNTIVSLLCLLIIVEAVFIFIKRMSNFVEVYEHGIRGKGGAGANIMATYKHQQTFEFRYDEITSIRKGKGGLVITTRSGEFLSAISNINDAVQQVGAAAQAATRKAGL